MMSSFLNEMRTINVAWNIESKPGINNSDHQNDVEKKRTNERTCHTKQEYPVPGSLLHMYWHVSTGIISMES